MKILDVGQCGVDGPRIMELLRTELGAKVENARTLAEATKKVADGGFDLVLVNRVLAADGSSGMDVVEAIVGGNGSPPVMLVSDLEDAQKEAVSRGAVQGFGKSILEDPAVIELIRSAAER